MRPRCALLQPAFQETTMPIIDPFAGHVAGFDSPVRGGYAITPDDDADLPKVTRAVMVAEGGDLSVAMLDGTALVLPALVPGAIYPVRLTRVNSSGTTAAGVVGLY